nr:PGC-1 and ERR-induced regulator in muscle protein 1 [Nothobranchius furzeri]
MDDFEYSVEIGDRDWESFFAVCEECDLLPPKLAGVDDSGMSDIDDPFLPQRVQRCDSTLDFSEQGTPPDCHGSPTGKQGLCGLDSVLSGSEEDIHMQSINMFFERLKGLTDVQPSQGRTRHKRETKQEEEHWGEGQQTSIRAFPMNCAKLNTGAVGKESPKPVDTFMNLNTTVRCEAERSVSSKPATRCDSAPVICKSAEKELFIKKEALKEALVKEITHRSPSHRSTERGVCSEMTPQSYKLETCKGMDDVHQESQEVLSKKNRMREDHVPTHKLSPSVFLRRKRRKRRPLSVEADGDEKVRESHVSVKNDSKEELQVPRKEECQSLSLNYLRETQKCCKCLYSFSPSTRNFTAQDAENEPPGETLHRRSTETSDKPRSETRLSPSEDHLMSAAGNGANEAASSQPCCKVQPTEPAGRSQKQEVKGDDLQESDQTTASVFECVKEQNLKHSTSEVKRVSLDLKSCAPVVDVGQNDNLSATNSVLAAGDGNSVRDERALRQSEAESQQQLENDTNHFHTARLSEAAADGITSHLSTRPFLYENSNKNICSESNVKHSPLGSLSNYPSEKTETIKDRLTEAQTSDVLSENDKKVERTPVALILDLTSQSKHLPENPLDVTPVPPHTDKPTEVPQRLRSPVMEHESAQEKQKAQIMAKHDKDDRSAPSNQTESINNLISEAEETISASKDGHPPENSVFAMSSFWNEMEKLTINDILGLRQICKAAPLGPLPCLQEREKTEVMDVVDSDNLTELKSEQITEEMTDSSSLRGSWESELAGVGRISYFHPEPGVLASVSDTYQPVLNEKAQKCLRKISKTVSVHNLQALDSPAFSYRCQKETIQILEEQKSEESSHLTEKTSANKSTDHFLSSSSTDSYSFSFTDIIQYFFGGKQSVSSQSAPDDATTHLSGTSVPETYDDFFSEFDSESFFYPFITAEEQNKDKPVPIFSCSRSTSRTLQFPDAYEHFFASSSSDDSSVESEEEEASIPVRVVSRFTRKASTAQLCKDSYEDFFTDKDLREDFFSLQSLSFRKIHLSAPTVQNQNSLVPLRQSSQYMLKMESRLNVLGHPDVMFPDPLLYNLEDRISKQLALPSFRSENLQVSDPRLDAPFLPLKQSDMCLVCIAFASWVLKTANPQVGDTWKAVLLANVSALSAIRYLRKYIRAEAVTSEMKPPQNTLANS